MGKDVIATDHRTRALTPPPTPTIMSGLMIALLLTLAWAVAPAGVHALEGTVGCGGNNCVDIWKVKCASASTHSLCARLQDNEGCALGDDVMVLTLVATNPPGIFGQGDIASAQACVVGVCVARPAGAPVGPITALATVSVTSAGSTGYNVNFFCADKMGFPIHNASNPTATLITSQ